MIFLKQSKIKTTFRGFNEFGDKKRLNIQGTKMIQK